MAEPEKIQEPNPALGANETAKAATGAEAKSELPHVESPPISPADHMPAGDNEKPAPEIHALTIFKPRTDEAPKAAGFTFPDFTVTLPQITISRRTKRRIAMAATVALAAAFGAIAGALATQNLRTVEAPKTDTAAAEEAQAMRKSIAHLLKEVTTLKAGIETASKSATVQIGKIATRIDKLDTTDITGSIGKPQTVAAVETPLPPVKPPMAPQVTQEIVRGWTVRASRNGAILVEGRGEIYQVSLGVPLPGLGPVESIKRDNGRWVVTTPKGIIVSSNQPPPRPRAYYPPPYFRVY